jgi:hypothetical protein
MITSLTWISAVGYIQNIEHQFTFNKPHYKGHTHGLYIYSFCCIPAARNLLGSRDSWYSAVKEAISWRVNQLSPPIFPSLFKMDLVIKQTSRYYTITSEISLAQLFLPAHSRRSPYIIQRLYSFEIFWRASKNRVCNKYTRLEEGNR